MNRTRKYSLYILLAILPLLSFNAAAQIPDSASGPIPPPPYEKSAEDVHFTAPRTFYITAYAVNIRSGPGLEFDKIGVVFLNTEIKVFSDYDNWFEVSIGDTLIGWIAQRFAGIDMLEGIEKDRLIYRDGDLQAKINVIQKLAQAHSGPEFELLKQIIIRHVEFDMGIDNDKILLPEIFKNWAENQVVESMTVLLYVLENDIKGDIANSKEAMNEVKLAAKEAVKYLAKL